MPHPLATELIHRLGMHLRSRSFSCRAGLIALAAVCVALNDAHGELTWAQKAIDLRADAGTNVLEGRYRFTNSGKTPVDIREVDTSCGCTTAALAQRHYDPGQSGEIVVRFTVGERVGLQKKSIVVSTSDQPVATALTLNIYIPELVHIDPTALTWTEGDPATPKTIGITGVDAGTPLKDVTVQSSNQAVSAELLTLLDGSKYQIRVTPTSTEKPVFATLTVQSHIGSAAKSFRAYAMVRAAAVPAAPRVQTAPQSEAPKSEAPKSSRD